MADWKLPDSRQAIILEQRLLKFLLHVESRFQHGFQRILSYDFATFSSTIVQTNCAAAQ
jgi:hypothetical protein